MYLLARFFVFLFFFCFFFVLFVFVCFCFFLVGGLLYFLHFFILICSFLYVMCKVSPDCDLIMLPAADKKTVWSIFNQELLERAINVPKLPYFCKVWRTDEHCRKLKIRKWLRFAKCTTCIDFRKRRSEAKTTTEKDVVKKEERLHHM